MINCITKLTIIFVSLSYITALFADPKITYRISCKDTPISLGMTKDDILKACGQPSDEYNGTYKGHSVLKLKYIHSDKEGSALILRFSSMESGKALKLYKIQLTEWNDEYNPY